MSIDAYLQRQDAERILLVELIRNTDNPEHFYLSDSAYATESEDDPASILFSPIIGGRGIPDLRRILSDPFDGSGSTSFGSITLVDDEAAYKSFDNDPFIGESGIKSIPFSRGMSVEVRLAAPRHLFPYSDAKLLMCGQLARVSGNSEGETTLEITDRSEYFRSAVISSAASPLSFGLVRNIEPRLIDAANLVYKVHDGQIDDVLAVYDDGVFIGASGYTKDLANGEFTLSSIPAGTVTADVQGAAPQGNWLSSTEQIASELISRSGLSISQTYQDVDGSNIGLFINDDLRLGETLTALFRGAAAYWNINPIGEVYAAPYPIPGTNNDVPEVVTIDNALEPITYQDDDRLYSEIRYLYRRNWTRYQARAGAAPEIAAFSQSDGLEGSVQVSTNTELFYSDAPRLDTFFDNQANAQNAASRLSSIFGVQRRRHKTSIPYSFIREMDDPVLLNYNDQNFAGVIVSMTDVFDGSFPAQRIEVLS